MVKAPLEAELLSFPVFEKGNEKLTTSYLNSYGDNGLFERIGSCENERDLPDVLTYLGFGVPFCRRFRERFVEKGVFESLTFSPASRRLAEKGFQDPENRYTVLAFDPMVMVVDYTRLGGRKVPATWADMLEPAFEKSVAIVGRGTSFNEAVLLAIYKSFGLEGVRRLGSAISWVGHPAEMVKVAGRGLPHAPAISVVDYFFARMIKRQNHISIVWPKTGALAIPFVALVKADPAGKFRQLSRFLTGPVFARICADAYFFPAHGSYRPNLPESLKLDWLGWEYLIENDLEVLMAKIRAALFPSMAEAEQ